MTAARRIAAAIGTLLLAALAPVAAQQIDGRTFEDRNANGILDPGEPVLPGVDVRLFGTATAAIDQTISSAADGSFAFAPGNGCYLVVPTDPPGWRATAPRSDGFVPGSPGYVFPVGRPRFSKVDRAVDNLQGGGYVYASIGDSIAWNFNLCGYPESFWYSKRIRDRLACVAPTAGVTLVEAAIKGEHTDDLLVDQGGESNNVFRLLDLAPELITISMIGNDLLDVDAGSNPSQAQINRAVAEVLDARQNLQEVLSTLTAALPGTDLALNTLYDNETWNCYSGDPSLFHRTWIPIVNRMLRELAWGQARRAATIEVAAEFAHEDQLGDCTGYDGMICRDIFSFDTIHPTNPGFTILREKVWEAVGGVNLGPGDALGRGSLSDVDHGFLRRVRRLSPRVVETRNGASVLDADAALVPDDGDAAARITLGAGTEELRLSGFPDWFDEIRIARVIAGVRYRTVGTVADDFYRIEASIDDAFRPPPGFAYTPTRWNFFTPIVGGGGPNQPAENPDYPAARVLATPDVASFREASAMLGKDPELAPGAAEYTWPAVTHAELATTTLRVASAAVGGTPGNDPYAVLLDHAWLDLYGWEVARPPEVTGLRVDRGPGGEIELRFDELPGAQRYNAYAGDLDSLRGGVYDHGTETFCAAGTLPAGAGRRLAAWPGGTPAGDAVYFLVTGHVDDVESPAGVASDGNEIDRSQSTCR